MYKISEQQVNPKVLSVTNSFHYNENFKNGKHCLWTNARPSGAAPTNPHLLGKSPRVRGGIFGANPWECTQGEGLVMDEINTCIMAELSKAAKKKRCFKDSGSQ